MNTVWTVKIHKLVLSEDFKLISPENQRFILQHIRKKLTIDPLLYGKPLIGELKGYWRLRVGDFRVIYKINRKNIEVLVVKVGIRRNEEVYRSFFHRMKKLREKV
ncbi:MAG: type II toxin-antitoxin system RelE/ParE family toxin [Candidatus Omnitrophica bacterium]|nr:type II toxin-antitoxin system RelE/ParE family toxin [Candidatus Omnitrophota bacterium]